MAEKSSRSLTRRPSRADSAAMRDRNRCSRVGVPGHVLLQQAGRVPGDRGQRGPQLVAEPAQERLLELARVPQRHRLLLRDQRLLPLERHPQRVGRVLEQVGRVVRRSPSAHDDSSTVRPAGAANVTDRYRPRSRPDWPPPVRRVPRLACPVTRRRPGPRPRTARPRRGSPRPPARRRRRMTPCRPVRRPGQRRPASRRRRSSSRGTSSAPSAGRGDQRHLVRARGRACSACSAMRSAGPTGTGPARVCSISLIVSSSRLRAVTSSSSWSRSIALAAYPA